MRPPAVCALVLRVAGCTPRPSHQSNLKPQYGAWGFDLAGEDTTTRPGDDFFGHVNGGWLNRTAIPGGPDGDHSGS